MQQPGTTLQGSRLDVPEWFEEIHLVDADAHLVEPPDLWSSRAPAAYRDRVPQVRELPEGPHWVVDGVVLAPTHPGGGVVLADGTKTRGADFFNLGPEVLHVASWDPAARLEVMDAVGLYAQVCYPQVGGFGGHNFQDVADAELRRLCVAIYNDAMVEVQESTGGRVLPMAGVPWWDVEASVQEVRRAAGAGLRGIVMCSDPQNRGGPDLAERAWDPFWEVCSELGMPVNFHIGASEEVINGWYGKSPWPSLGDDEKLAIGTTMMTLSNGRVIANLIFSGVLERFPDLKVVSVESGIGWLPYLLESLDHQYHEARADRSLRISMPPSEYFRRQIYGCFWFERLAPQRLLDAVGVDNAMFETDFPHPTCLYPDSLEHVFEVFEDVDAVVRRKVLQDNAARLYRIPLPEA